MRSEGLIDWLMLVVPTFILGGAVVVATAGFLLAGPDSWITFQRASGYTPDVAVIRFWAPDQGRVCVEAPNGQQDCRSVADLKLWARERRAK